MDILHFFHSKRPIAQAEKGSKYDLRQYILPGVPNGNEDMAYHTSTSFLKLPLFSLSVV
jgi:hypothetical protein